LAGECSTSSRPTGFAIGSVSSQLEVRHAALSRTGQVW
jgi:hypothetical protein